MKNFLKIFHKISQGMQQDDALKEALRNKYMTFQSLLADNNHVLTLMADLEEKLSGEYLFDMHYIHTNVRSVAEVTLKIIRHINALSQDKYVLLYKMYDVIREQVERSLVRKVEIPVSSLTIPIEGLVKEMSAVAGGKIAHLGEVKNRLRLLIPDGFSITAYAFKRFIEHNGLMEEIKRTLSAMSIDNLEDLNKTSEQIQAMITAAKIPDDLQDAVRRAYRDLCGRVSGLSKDGHSQTPIPAGDTQKSAGAIRVSVRSSAIHEDGEFSFAGQYATCLNVPGDYLLEKYKEVVASLFTPRALFYCKTKGFAEEDMVMAVGVLHMIDAKAGGVMYTRDPSDPEKDTIIINAVWGLGKSVVDGTKNPQSFILSRQSGALLQEGVSQQRSMAICAPGGGVGEVDVRDSMKGTPCLSGEQIKTLFHYASTLENHYGRPQDIEWAIGVEGDVYILQSRPLRTFTPRTMLSNLPRRIEGHTILLDKGVIACKGVGYGKAFVVKDEEDLKDFPEGAVLVARHTSPKFVTVMNRAAAIITDVGSTTGHMASLSREYGIPTILDTESATDVIQSGQGLTVDAVNCNVYEGRVERLLEYAAGRREIFKGTPLFMILEKVLKLIVPLNLVDPDHENFKPEYCKTFHDITRFCHEMAMAEIFKTGKGQTIDSFEDLMSAISFAEEGEAGRLGSQTSALRAGIPIDAHLLDIDGSIKNDLKKVTPADIISVPFSAFLRGLTSMRWPEPRPADVKGFLGMVAHTATIQEEELRRMGGKSYAIISTHYMNFSIRLGYHFSMVEAYAGENMNDNYIKFFFKGGGAATDRRLRRVRLIKELLRKMDFKVTVIEDVIDAMLTKYKQSTIEHKLEVMGKLTVYTKQLDMVMYNDAVTDMFIGDFVRDHLNS